MRVAIVGPGAMGLLFAARLADAAHDVALVGRAGEDGAGVTIELVEGDRVRSAHAHAATAEPFDLAVACVKSYDTSRAAREHAGLLRNAARVLTLQNGLGNVERLAEVVDPARLFAGTTTEAALREGVRRVRHTGQGLTSIGAVGETGDDDAEAIAAAFSAAGFAATTSARILADIWEKVAVNAGINALTAILGVPNGFIASDADARGLAIEAVGEAVEVARAEGVALDRAALQSRCLEVARLTAANRSSMLSDLIARRRTEIDDINGAIVRIGAAHHIDAPVNRVLAKLVLSLERRPPS
ncbi:2-dehydropantoate 2-reductase [bacterium]|nr:2-dehydropantoate 2-reductase [bacterium]